LLVFVFLAAGVHMVEQFEQADVLRFGRLRPRLRGPGLQLIIPLVDRLNKISPQTVVMGVPPQAAIEHHEGDAGLLEQRGDRASDGPLCALVQGPGAADPGQVLDVVGNLLLAVVRPR